MSTHRPPPPETIATAPHLRSALERAIVQAQEQLLRMRRANSTAAEFVQRDANEVLEVAERLINAAGLIGSKLDAVIAGTERDEYPEELR